MIRMVSVVFMAALVVAISPADVVAMARRDAASLPPEVRPYIRYVSLHNIAEKDRPDYVRLVDFCGNSISRQTEIEHVYAVPGANLALVRFDLRQFGLTAERFDNLSRRGSGPVRSVKKIDTPEPYFHQLVKYPAATKTVTKTRKVTVQDAYGRQYVQDQQYQEQETTETRTELKHAGWLDQGQAIALAAELHSDFGIVRADWLIANALFAPAYYELLDIRTLKDFEDFAQFDERSRKQATYAVVTNSGGVALHQRGVIGTRTALGYFWETLDYADSVAENDILVNLDLFVKKGGRPKRDAGELIANGPNGMQFYALVDGQDKILDVAAPQFAIDTETAWADHQVWTSKSCITCHAAGMKDVNDEVRALSAPPNFLLTPDKDKFDLLYHHFRRPLEGDILDAPLTTTKIQYMQQIAKATAGMTPKELSEAIERAFLGYTQDPITLETAAAEVGCTPAEARAILDRIIGPAHTLRQLQAGRKVRRDQWEVPGGDEVLSGFGQLATLVYQAKKGGKK